MAFNTKPAITRTFIWVVTISRISDRRARISWIPCPDFGKSRFPESSQILIRVKIVCVFPNPTPCFGHIQAPENTIPDPGKLQYWFLFIINTTMPFYAFHDRINDEVLTKFRSVGWSVIYILCLKDGWGGGILEGGLKEGGC